MQWADAIFPFENKPDNTQFVRRIWRTGSVAEKSFISVAVPYWEIVFAQRPDGLLVVARGPETIASVVEIPPATEFFGIQFQLGAFMPQFPISSMVNGIREVVIESERAMRIDGCTWEIPTYENADVFVNRLARKGLLTRDPLVESILQHRKVDLSARSVQRRFLTSTGLTFGAVRQMERARKACEAMLSGMSILDTAEHLGYSDQAHLTRSLKRFCGLLPSQIRAGSS